MKKFRFLTLFTALTFAAAMIISGCTKEGPQGPAGEDGTDGTDGTAGCIQCHDDSQMILAASLQWEASTHATGGNFERNGTSCAPCHTSQGFLDVVETGAQESSAALSNPVPPNCYTCHNIHETYTPEDWQFTKTEPTELWINGEVLDYGKANLCTQCHQPRIPSPMFDVNSSENLEITSQRWGPHHGPQSAILAGTAGYEVDGSMSYTDHPHTNTENGCVTCHMASAYGTQAGGHTMNVAYNYHGHTELNTAGCYVSGCHDEEEPVATLFKENWKPEIDGLLTELRSELLAQSLIDSSNLLIIPENDPLVVSMDQAGAIWNYLLVLEDRSMGAHNYKYARALLTNSLEAIQD